MGVVEGWTGRDVMWRVNDENPKNILSFFRFSPTFLRVRHTRPLIIILSSIVRSSIVRSSPSGNPNALHLPPRHPRPIPGIPQGSTHDTSPIRSGHPHSSHAWTRRVHRRDPVQCLHTGCTWLCSTIVLGSPPLRCLSGNAIFGPSIGDGTVSGRSRCGVAFVGTCAVGRVTEGSGGREGGALGVGGVLGGGSGGV